MSFNIGDYVTRKSYNNDIIFKIVKIEEDLYYLEEKNTRLCADAMVEDLELSHENDDEEFLKKIEIPELERDDYFYLPGKILHIDGDQEYLNRCLSYYNKCNIMAAGVLEKEENMSKNMSTWLREYNPDIVVITGHDAYYRKRGNRDNLSSYKNSKYFVDSVKAARLYEKSHEKLIVIAGGCQSNYEELIKAGANFASSPKRVNIHALDPAIIAVKMGFSDINKDISLKNILENTKYGSSGIGGIITKGTMHIGYPR